MPQDGGTKNKWMDLRDIQKKNKICEEVDMGSGQIKGGKRGNAQVFAARNWVKDNPIGRDWEARGDIRGGDEFSSDVWNSKKMWAV